MAKAMVQKSTAGGFLGFLFPAVASAADLTNGLIGGGGSGCPHGCQGFCVVPEHLFATGMIASALLVHHQIG